MKNDMLASFGMWLARRFGSVRPGDKTELEEQQYVTITEFEGFPVKTVRGGPYSSLEFAELAAKVARIQLGVFPVPVRVRIEPLLVGRPMSEQAEKPMEAKP